MNKRLSIVVIVIFVAALVFFFTRSNRPSSPEVRTETTSDIQTPPSDSSESHKSYELRGKRVVGLPPGEEEKGLKKMKVVNSPSTEWKTGLENALRAQGGEDLKEITMNSIDSFVWAQDGVALFVESVIVTIKNRDDVKTTFRVLVDAQTGKILRNWDQPVIDPLTPHDDFKIKVDPRYHAD